LNLSVSNIAWAAESDEAALAALRRGAISAVEIAPTRIWPDWAGASAASAQGVARHFADRGFRVSSLQALLFGKPECQLLGSSDQRQALLDHLTLCADLAAALGAESLVFGAPKNRSLCGRSASEAFRIACEFFCIAGREFAARGLCLCLEANPSEYGCEFITDSAQAARLVRAVNCSGFGLHLDTGCMQLSNEDPVQAICANIDIMRHFHVSEPFLNNLSDTTLNHRRIGKTLQDVGYGRWATLEMRAALPPLAALAGSLDLFVNSYAPAPVT